MLPLFDDKAHLKKKKMIHVYLSYNYKLTIGLYKRSDVVTIYSGLFGQARANWVNYRLQMGERHSSRTEKKIFVDQQNRPVI